MSNFNIDENTINKLKDMMNKGELNDIISKIPPDMVQNMSSMLNNNSDTSNKNNNVHTNSPKNNSNFNFNNIDMNTIMKMKSIIDKMNSNTTPGSNLLHSLKPYLRESRKEKIDQYANLLNMAQIAELLRNNNNESDNNNNG